VKLGLDSYSYHFAAGLWEFTPRENPPMTVEHFLRKASEFGLNGVQLCDPRHLDSLDYGYVSDLRQRAESLGLYLELGTSGTNPDHLQNMVRAAHVLGSSIVRTFVGRPRPASADGMSRLVAAAVEDLAQVAPVCERYQVALALENHQDLTSGELLNLLEMLDSPWLGICFDTGNPLALLEDPVEAARALAPFTRTVHLKDYQVAVVQLAEILDLLRSDAPDSTVNLENYLGKHLVPALEDEYLIRLRGRSALDLGRTLRLVRDRGLRREPEAPVEGGTAEQDLLAAEEELVLRSARWAQRALGLPEAELPAPDG
jgi:sugar phosphate isomerase/epimerase